MSRIALTCVVALGLLAGCPSDDDDQPGADSGQCTCPTPTAQKTTYDNQSSQLGASNVQDAVDELAARPLPEKPISQRIETVVVMHDNPGLAQLFLTTTCNSVGDIALGGSCTTLDAADGGGRPIGFGPVNPGGQSKAGYTCVYEQPAGVKASKVAVAVVCLKVE